MKNLLITGFEPFGDCPINPSWMAVEQLPEQVGEYCIHKLALPTIFGHGAQLVQEAADRLDPAVILCVGQAAGRDAVTPERIAVNIRDARIPDNRGYQPRGERIDPAGPAAWFATVPVEKMAEAIRQAGIPACVSNSAGAYVCNDVLYTLLNHYGTGMTRVGFIHVPNTPELNPPHLPLETITRALICAIEAC